MHFDRLRRREFITLLGGAAAAWPLAARGQQARTRPLVGWLGGSTQTAGARNHNAFLQELKERGYEDGKTIDIVHRWANGDLSLHPVLAKELVALNPDVIVAAAAPGSVALMQATAAIPIVGALTFDPIRFGLAVSHNRPGRNFTGVLTTIDGLSGKQAGLLLQLLPHASKLGVLMNPESPTAPLVLREIESTLRGTSIQIMHSAVRKSADLRVAFGTLESERVDGVVVVGDSVIFTEAAQVISLAAAARLPAIHGFRQHVEQGGLMSYGLDIPQNFRRAAYFVDRILKGTKPADLPIELPPRFELVINLNVAKALGLEVPPTLLALADEVIE
jgi:putative ABC transport system substrate-binding protein